MNNCLNCGAEIKQKEGARKRKFCDNQNKCKQAYHNKKNGSGYKPKRKHLSVEEYEKLIAQIKENNKPENKQRIEAERAGVANDTKKQRKQPLTPQDCEAEPIKQEGESSIDYRYRYAEWLERKTK